MTEPPSERNGYRTQSFLDTLTSDEAAESKRVMEMPTAMALAFLTARVMRLQATIDGPSRPKQAGVGIASGTVGATIALVVQQILGALDVGL